MSEPINPQDPTPQPEPTPTPTPEPQPTPESQTPPANANPTPQPEPTPTPTLTGFEALLSDVPVVRTTSGFNEFNSDDGSGGTSAGGDDSDLEDLLHDTPAPTPTPQPTPESQTPPANANPASTTAAQTTANVNPAPAPQPANTPSWKTAVKAALATLAALFLVVTVFAAGNRFSGTDDKTEPAAKDASQEGSFRTIGPEDIDPAIAAALAGANGNVYFLKAATPEVSNTFITPRGITVERLHFPEDNPEFLRGVLNEEFTDDQRALNIVPPPANSANAIIDSLRAADEENRQRIEANAAAISELSTRVDDGFTNVNTRLDGIEKIINDRLPQKDDGNGQ